MRSQFISLRIDFRENKLRWNASLHICSTFAQLFLLSAECVIIINELSTGCICLWCAAVVWPWRWQLYDFLTDFRGTRIYRLRLQSLECTFRLSLTAFSLNGRQATDEFLNFFLFRSPILPAHDASATFILYVTVENVSRVSFPLNFAGGKKRSEISLT